MTQKKILTIAALVFFLGCDTYKAKKYTTTVEVKYIEGTIDTLELKASYRSYLKINAENYSPALENWGQVVATNVRTFKVLKEEGATQ
jgi:hypothetical protein